MPPRQSHPHLWTSLADTAVPEKPEKDSRYWNNSHSASNLSFSPKNTHWLAAGPSRGGGGGGGKPYQAPELEKCPRSYKSLKFQISSQQLSYLPHNTFPCLKSPSLVYLLHRLTRTDLHARRTGQGGSQGEAKAGNVSFIISLPTTNFISMGKNIVS